MYLEQLIYITEVYKTGTISEAAKKCHISLPGISQSISSLEKELGVDIFKRSRVGVTPTVDGMKIINKAFEVIAKLNELREIIKPENMLINTKLNISASPSLIVLLLKSAQAFKENYPNVSIEITEKTAPEIIRAIQKQEINFGMTAINKEILINYEELNYNVLLKGKRYVCVNRHSPLAMHNSIKPQELLNQQLVLYNGVYLKSFVYNFFKKHGKMKWRE